MHSITSITEPDIADLSLACTDAQTIPFDCMKGCGDTWEYTQADECSSCAMPLLVRHGEAQHRDLDDTSTCEGYVSGDGPMFNYLYPISSVPADDEIPAALADLPLCVVTMTDDDRAFLGLTGGGMNMAWYICTAYVRLGYLPPFAYRDLPTFVGMTMTDPRRVIAACLKTTRVTAHEAERIAAHLRALWAGSSDRA